MMNKLKQFIPALIVGLVFTTVSAMAATVLFPSQGGTGTTTRPGKGSVLVGASSTAYGVLATSTDGKCLTASSTATLGVSWEDCPGGLALTSLNGSTSSTQTFATGTDTNLLLTITTVNGVHTFTPSWTSTLAAGRLNANVVQGVTNDTNVTGSISAQNLTLGWTGQLGISRGGTGTSTTPGQDNILVGNGTNYDLRRLQASSGTIISTSTPGVISIGKQPSKCQWVATYSTSTTAWSDDFCIINTTSTIREIWVKQQTTGDSVAWNLYYAATMPASTSTGAFKVFSADQTTTATTTAKLTPTASSTPNLGDFLRIYAYNASSTELTMTIYYDEN